MDVADLESEIRAAAMSVEDLERRVDGAVPEAAQELEIDASLIEQELEGLDNKLDELRGDWEASDQVVHPDDAPDFAELDRQIESARDALRDACRRIDDIPELQAVESLRQWDVELSPEALGQLRDPGIDL